MRVIESEPSVESFDDFARAALPELLRFGLLLCGSRATAEDLAQSALERALRAWRRIDAGGNPTAYAKTTMARLNVDRWRRFGRRETGWDDALDAASGVGDHAQAIVERAEALELLRGLPQRQRAVLVLRYYDDMSEAQIADALNCSVGTVKSHASRALQALRERHASSSTSAEAS